MDVATIVMLILVLTTAECIAKMEVGCLKYPGASTIGSQTAPMAGKSWQPSHHAVRGTGTRHTVETVERGRALPGR